MLSLREAQVSFLCAAAFARLPSLKYMVIMGEDEMYGMRRGEVLARKPLLDHDSLWFPDIYSL